MPFFAGYGLADIEAPDVKDLALELEHSGAPRSTIRKRLAPLGALLATAVEDGLIRANPARGIRLGPAPQQERTVRQALTRAELSILLWALPPGWRLFFELLAHTGLRISEAVAQLWETRHHSDYRGNSDPVFPSSIGTPFRPHNLYARVLKPAAKRAKLDWVGFHSFRHTCASLLFEAGKNPKQVQEWLGHHDPGYTLRTYVHLLDSGLGDADFLDDAVQVASAGLPQGLPHDTPDDHISALQSSECRHGESNSDFSLERAAS